MSIGLIDAVARYWFALVSEDEVLKAPRLLLVGSFTTWPVKRGRGKLPESSLLSLSLCRALLPYHTVDESDTRFPFGDTFTRVIQIGTNYNSPVENSNPVMMMMMMMILLSTHSPSSSNFSLIINMRARVEGRRGKKIQHSQSADDDKDTVCWKSYLTRSRALICI